MGLAYHYLEESEAAALLGALKMANALEEMIAGGIMQGKRDALRTLLRTRFGAIPPALEERIEAANSDELEALVVRAVQVERIEEL